MNIWLLLNKQNYLLYKVFATSSPGPRQSSVDILFCSPDVYPLVFTCEGNSRITAFRLEPFAIGQLYLLFGLVYCYAICCFTGGSLSIYLPHLNGFSRWAAVMLKKIIARTCETNLIDDGFSFLYANPRLCAAQKGLRPTNFFTLNQVSAYSRDTRIFPNVTSLCNEFVELIEELLPSSVQLSTVIIFESLGIDQSIAKLLLDEFYDRRVLVFRHPMLKKRLTWPLERCSICDYDPLLDLANIVSLMRVSFKGELPPRICLGSTSVYLHLSYLLTTQEMTLVRYSVKQNLLDPVRLDYDVKFLSKIGAEVAVT
jgi:hypothetical protein